MNLQDHLLIYILTVVFSIAVFGLSIWQKKIAKVIFGMLFFASGALNIFLSVSIPESYVEAYSNDALFGVYRKFISGIFQTYTTRFVFLIGFFQMGSGFLQLFFRDLPYVIGVLMAMVFLMAVSPLGLAAGFPSSLIMALALLILLFKYR